MTSEERRVYNKNWRANHPEEVKLYHKKWHSDNPGKGTSYTKKYRATNPRFRILYPARDRANRIGLEFSITVDDIVIPEVCPVLGIPIFSSSRKNCDNSPSLDRIIPSMGYVPGNIQVMSMRANRIKNDGTAEEHESIAKFMRSFTDAKQ